MALVAKQSPSNQATKSSKFKPFKLPQQDRSHLGAQGTYHWIVTLFIGQLRPDQLYLGVLYQWVITTVLEPVVSNLDLQAEGGLGAPVGLRTPEPLEFQPCWALPRDQTDSEPWSEGLIIKGVTWGLSRVLTKLAITSHALSFDNGSAAGTVAEKIDSENNGSSNGNKSETETTPPSTASLALRMVRFLLKAYGWLSPCHYMTTQQVALSCEIVGLDYTSFFCQARSPSRADDGQGSLQRSSA